MLWQLLNIALFAPFVDSARGADSYKVTLADLAGLPES